MSEYTAADFDRADIAVHRRESDAYRRDTRTGKWLYGTTSEMLAQNGDWIPVRVADLTRNPYSPEALAEAWENGETPEHGERAVEGTVTILDVAGMSLTLHANEAGEQLGPSHRIVYRPPAPEPEEPPSLRELLGDLVGTIIIHDDTLDEWAEALEAKGVRVVTDDE